MTVAKKCTWTKKKKHYIRLFSHDFFSTGKVIRNVGLDETKRIFLLHIGTTCSGSSGHFSFMVLQGGFRL